MVREKDCFAAKSGHMIQDSLGLVVQGMKEMIQSSGCDESNLLWMKMRRGGICLVCW